MEISKGENGFIKRYDRGIQSDFPLLVFFGFCEEYYLNIHIDLLIRID